MQLRPSCPAHAGPTCTILLLQVVGVLQHRQHLKAVIGQPKESADADVVQAGTHRTVLHQQGGRRRDACIEVGTA